MLESQLCLSTYPAYIVCPWAVFQLATLLVPRKIMYVELAGALYHSWIEPQQRAIKVNNSGDEWIVIYLWDTGTKNGLD